MRAKFILITSLLLLMICSTTVGAAATVNDVKEQSVLNEPCLALFLHVDDVAK